MALVSSSKQNKKTWIGGRKNVNRSCGGGIIVVVFRTPAVGVYSGAGVVGGLKQVYRIRWGRHRTSSATVRCEALGIVQVIFNVLKENLRAGGDAIAVSYSSRSRSGDSSSNVRTMCALVDEVAAGVQRVAATCSALGVAAAATLLTRRHFV